MTQSSTSSQWLSLLQESGYRLTGPRRVIVEIMASSRCALGPVELYDLGRKEQPGLGLVTVYRTLEKLEELGLVQRVHHPNGCHMYIRSAHGHEHLLLCTRCGKCEFFSGDDLTQLMSTISQHSGFEICDHWLQLIGICPSCRKL